MRHIYAARKRHRLSHRYLFPAISTLEDVNFFSFFDSVFYLCYKLQSKNEEGYYTAYQDNLMMLVQLQDRPASFMNNSEKYPLLASIFENGKDNRLD
jgi:hypothetical protein